MTEKTNNFMDVESLLQQVENTKFTLQRKNDSSRLVRYYDEKAETILNEVKANYSEPKQQEIFSSRITALNEERSKHFDRIGEYIAEDIKLLNSLTDRQEKAEIVEDVALLLKEYAALLHQSFRKPWTMCY